MPPKAKKSPSRAKARTSGQQSATSMRPVSEMAQEVLAWLERTSTKAARDGMARYGIPSDNAYGVGIGVLQKYAKGLGRNHDLAEALWNTGRYEARILASYIDEPDRVTPTQMDRWCRGFDSWAICDTVCFCLFDRTPHAWSKVSQWAKRRDEFVKRAAFALLASLVAHDKKADDSAFADGLLLIEREAGDERNFVMKGISWALRCIGKRSPALNAAAIAVAKRLIESPEPAARWIGKGGLKELTSPALMRRLKGSPRAAGES